MIYVENTSRNGSRLERTYVDSAGYECTTTKLLAPATAPVPFLHGDKIFLNRQSDIYVQLLMYVDSHMPPISTLMAREIEVGYKSAMTALLLNLFNSDVRRRV